MEVTVWFGFRPLLHHCNLIFGEGWQVERELLVAMQFSAYVCD